MSLDKEQIDLLCNIVEATRNIPKDKRSKFIALQSSTRTTLHNWSLPNWYLEVYKGDIEILDRNGLLNLSLNSQGDYIFDLLPEAFQYYEEIKKVTLEPMRDVEKDIRHYISDIGFQKRYAKTYELWTKAENKLWSADSKNELTSIGLLCREAVQEFVDILLQQYEISNADADKSHTVNRLRALLNHFSHRIGSTITPFLEALLSYFGTLEDLIQRQVHGATKEGEELEWDDARRVVFQCAVVMYEIDRSFTFTLKK